MAWLAERVDSYAFYSREVWLRSLPTFIIATITLVGIGVLAWRNGRTYCNTILSRWHHTQLDGTLRMV